MIKSLNGLMSWAVQDPSAEKVQKALEEAAEADRILQATKAALSAAGAAAAPAADASEEANNEANDKVNDEANDKEQTPPASAKADTVRKLRARNVAAQIRCYLAYDFAHVLVRAACTERYGEDFRYDVEDAWDEIEHEASGSMVRFYDF